MTAVDTYLYAFRPDEYTPLLGPSHPSRSPQAASPASVVPTPTPTPTPVRQPVELPEIVITTSDAIPRRTRHGAAKSHFDALEVPLTDRRNELLDKIETREDKAIKDAEEAIKKANKADVKLARKTFLIKLAKACAAIGAFAVALGLAVPTGGLSIAPAVILGVAAVFSVSDAACAGVDWGLKANGREGLPMECDATANIAYAIFRLFKVSEENAEKYAGRTSTVIKVVMTVGLLWADTVAAKPKVKSCDVAEQTKKALDAARDKLTKYADSIDMTKAKLETLENEAKLKDVYAKELTEDSEQLGKIDLNLDSMEGDFEQRMDKKNDVIEIQKQKLVVEIKQARTKLQQLNQVLQKMSEQTAESLNELQTFLKLKDSTDEVLQNRSGECPNSHVEMVFSASQVPLLSDYKYSEDALKELRASHQAVEQAQRSLNEAELKMKKNVAKVKVFRCVLSVLSVAGSCVMTILTNPVAAAPLIYFSVGSAITSCFDAGAAVVEYRRFKNELEPLPIQDNGIANAIYYLLANGLNVNPQRAVSIAKTLSGVLVFCFTLGGKLPDAQPEFDKNKKQLTKYTKPIEDLVDDILLNESDIKDARMKADIEKLRTTLAEEQLYRISLINAEHNEQMRQIWFEKCFFYQEKLIERKHLNMRKAETEAVIADVEQWLQKLLDSDVQQQLLDKIETELLTELNKLVKLNVLTPAEQAEQDRATVMKNNPLVAYV